MGHEFTACFRVGKDYHLGDLLWLTAVIAEFRRQRQPGRVEVVCPDLPANRILERSPVVDEVRYLDGRSEPSGVDCRVHDLRPLSLARAMVRDWRYRWPWLYYRDLWLEPRGQWLATLLRLGSLRSYGPVLDLDPQDRVIASQIAHPYVLFAPHIGRYSLPLVGHFWRRVKGWPQESWSELAARLQGAGYHVLTLGAADDPAVPGTQPLLGLPINSVAGVVEQAAGLMTGESGLWFLAAALTTPFMIIPWWLPRSVNWPAALGLPHVLIYREEATVRHVFDQFTALAMPVSGRAESAGHVEGLW